MAGTAVKSVFIDTSVLFAACKSRYGASSQILAYCKRGKIKGHISLYVVSEVKRNISRETDQKVKQRLNTFLLGSKLKLVEPTESEINKCKQIIKPKDAPVLAAALKGKVDILVTLDRKDFFDASVKEFIKPIRIMTSKDVLNTFLR